MVFLYVSQKPRRTVPFLDPSPHSATKARVSPTGLFSERLFFFRRPPLLLPGTGSEAEDAATPSTRRRSHRRARVWWETMGNHWGYHWKEWETMVRQWVINSWGYHLFSKKLRETMLCNVISWSVWTVHMPHLLLMHEQNHPWYWTYVSLWIIYLVPYRIAGNSTKNKWADKIGNCNFQSFTFAVPSAFIHMKAVWLSSSTWNIWAVSFQHSPVTCITCMIRINGC